MQQQFGIGVDDVGELLFLLLGLGRADQLGKSHDGVERCAYLVAHVGQESRFEFVRLLGADACLDDLQLGVFLVGDVPRYADDQRQAVLDRDQRFGGVDDARLTRGVDILFDEGHALARAQQLEVVAAEMLGILRIGKDLQVGVPQRPFGRNARMFLERAVPVEVAEFVAGVFDEKVDRNVVQDAVEDRVHLFDLVLVLDAQRHVAAEEPDDLALFEMVVDDVGHHVPGHDIPLVVFETHRVFVRAVVAADFPEPLLPLGFRAPERPEIVDFVCGQLVRDAVVHAVLFVGILHRAVQVAGVNLLLDVVQGIFDHLQLVFRRLGLGDVAADAERMLAVEREDAVFVVAGLAVERDVVVRRRAVARGEDVVEVVAHIAARLGGEHRLNVLADEIAARDSDVVGTLGGDQFDEFSAPVEHGQHIGDRVENFTGEPLPEPCRGFGFRSLLPFEFLDPANQLLAGAIVISAHIQ